MTLRQLYYQLVSKDIIPNRQNEYAKISRVLTDARMAGMVDWDFIEDRGRVPKFPNQFDDINDAMRTINNAYRLDRWKGQNNYAEVIIEKDALSGVLEPVTREYHVHLVVNKGYSSATAMHELALRLREQKEYDKNCTIFYFGDHDPSGEQMVEDMNNRLLGFGCDVEVEKVALTMDQIEQYNPPANPVKISDSRSDSYIASHGDKSWELDALPPNVLVELVRGKLDGVLDRDAFDAVIKKEDEDKKKMERFGKRNKDDES